MNIAFDVKLFSVVCVDVPDGMDRKAAIALARKAIAKEIDCLNVSLAIDSTGDNGEPVHLTMTEAYADGEPDLFEVNGEGADNIT